MHRKRKHSPQSGGRRRRSNRRRRELLVIFALIFGAAGTRGVVHARPVPFAIPPVISTTATGAHSVYAADVDGDGDLDALSASKFDDKIAWYENAGGGATSWVLHTISTSADNARSVYAADVDGDGDLDALSASFDDDKIAWYENVGGGGTSWTLHTISASADGAFSVTAADVDGDGDLDALSASYGDDKIAWYENAGGGGTSWVLHTISTGADGAYSVYAADVDGDGDLDALSASILDDEVAWYENVGGGGTSWAFHLISTSGDGPVAVYAADVDGDGDLDALSASVYDGKVVWHENVGGGGTSWTLHTIAASANAVSVYAADVDGDGDFDVLLPSNYGNTIAWYENAGGGGTSWVLHTISSVANAFSVYAADLDGDGDLDVLSAASADHTIAWYRNDSIHRGVTFVSPPEISTSADSPFSVYAADVDGDGDLDALSASLNDDKIAWYENVGGGGTSWALHTISTSADGAISVYAADVDGDGDLDALSASFNDDKIAWYENVGGGGTSWALHSISTSADGASSVHAADVDGDGDLDALSTSQEDDKIAWYENVGGGGTSWTLHTISTSANGARSVYAADVDGDGDLDALSASYADDKVAWYENVGGGGTSWVLHTISSADGAFSVYAADVDGDGDLDTLSASFSDDKIAWYENVGGGGTSWALHTISTSAYSARSVYAADLDGDGDFDALSASLFDNKIAWYENVGGGGTSWALQTISTSALGAESVYAADVDGDGDLDVLSASADDDKIAWYENRVGGMDYYTVTPCRLLDTRIMGQGPALTSGSNRELVVPPNCGIPVDALAVALNVTAVSATVGGHVTVFPGGTAVPGTSTINFSAGQTRANNLIVGLAPDFSGKLLLRAVVPGGEVHFLVDVVGYF